MYHNSLVMTPSSGGKIDLKNVETVAKTTSMEVCPGLKNFGLPLILTYLVDNNDVYPQCKFHGFWMNFG